MKKILCNVAIAATLLFTPSCTTTNEIVVSKQESAEQIILRAEQTAETAKETFTLFVHIERDNESALKIFNPKIHEYAEKLRRNGQGWIRSLRSSTKTFKANRNAANQATLDTWLRTVNGALGETNRYLEQSKSVMTPQ